MRAFKGIDMYAKSQLQIILAYSIVLAPGCRQRVDSELQSQPDRESATSLSFRQTETYKKLADENLNSEMDKVFFAAQAEVDKRKLVLIRVSKDGGRQIAVGGLEEYWSHKYPDARYFFVDQLEKPGIALSVKPKLIEKKTVVLELIEHDPATFEIVDYQPLFIEMEKSDKDSLIKNVGEVQRALNSFAVSVSEEAQERAKVLSEPGMQIQPDQMKLLVKGMIVAAVGAAVGWVLASMLKKQNEGKFSWGLVASGAVVAVAVFMFVLYSSYEEEETEVPDGMKTDEKMEDSVVAKVSDRTWEFISIAR